MKITTGAPAITLFAVGVLETIVRWFFPSHPWPALLVGNLYYLAIVAAGILRGWKAAVGIACAAGVTHTVICAALSGDAWMLAAIEGVLFVCVGLVTGKLLEARHQAFLPLPASPGLSGEVMRLSLSQLGGAASTSAMSEIIAGLIHRFRTPLASIQGAGWVLADAELPVARREELVGIIQKESNRLDRALADVMNFFWPRKPRFQPTNLSAIVDEVIRSASPKVSGPFFLFRVEMPPDLPLVNCDGEQIKEMLLNLVINAIQASPGGAEIVIHVRPERGNVVFQVRDHGKGIPAEVLDRVFDPFFSTRDDGLGLGLAVARQIAIAHRGTISIQENSPNGVCQQVVLPLDAAARI